MLRVNKRICYSTVNRVLTVQFAPAKERELPGVEMLKHNCNLRGDGSVQLAGSSNLFAVYFATRRRWKALHTARVWTLIITVLLLALTVFLPIENWVKGLAGGLILCSSLVLLYQVKGNHKTDKLVDTNGNVFDAQRQTITTKQGDIYTVGG